MEGKVIAIDFDSTICEEWYPDVGPPLPGAIESINKLYNRGYQIVIWTCREGEYAENAILALEQEGAKYHRFNTNFPERTAKYGNDSRKIGFDISIEDKDPYWMVHGIDWKEIMSYIDQIELKWKEQTTPSLSVL